MEGGGDVRELRLGALEPNLAQQVIVDVPDDCRCGTDRHDVVRGQRTAGPIHAPVGRDPGMFAGMFHGGGLGEAQTRVVELGQVGLQCSSIKKKLPQRRVNIKKVVSR